MGATNKLGQAGKNGTRGFSLIELMVVVAIVAVLAAIAIPSYRQYVIRSKLTEAFSVLGDFRLRMEAFNQDNRSYANNGACGVALPGGNAFTFQCALAASGVQYTATATSKAGTGLGNAAGDYQFDINQDGIKSTPKFAGTAGSATDWQNI